MRILKLMVLMLLMAVGAQAQKTIQQNLSFRQEVGYLVTKYGATLYRNCGFPTNPDTLNARGKGFLAVDTCGFKFGIWNGTSWQEVSGAAAGDYLDTFKISQPATYRLVFTYGKNGVLNKDTIDYVAGAGGGSAGIDTMSIRNDSLIYRKEGIFYFAGKVSNAVINGDTTIWEVVVDSTTLSSYYIPIAQPSGYFGKDTTLRWRPTTGALVVGANANIVQLEVNGRVATTGNVSVGGQLSIALVPIATDTTFYKPMVRHTITGEIRRLESWPSTGMTNPMTSEGDLIRGGTSGTPTRIAAGTDGYVLTMNTGIPTWMAASSGTPAGSNTQLQYNNAGAFAGSSLLTWNNTTGSLNVAATYANSSANAQLRLFHNTEVNPRLWIRANPSVGAEIGTDNLAINFNVLSVTVPGMNLASSSFILKGSAGNTSTTARDLFGGASRVYSRAYMSASAEVSAWQNGAGNSATLLISQQTHNVVSGQNIASQLAIRPLLLTSSSLSTTNTATLFIEGANTQATNNYSMWVQSGVSRFGGAIILDPITIAQRNALPAAAGWKVYCSDCTATDGSTGVEQTYNGTTWKNHW